MAHRTTRIVMSAALAAFIVGVPLSASAAEMLTDAKGMTLYTFDKDAGGTPSCYDDCAAKWPPYLGKEGEAMSEGWTLVERTDKSMQWAYDGKPVYFFAGDKAKGDMKGEGMGGVWHVIKE